MPGSGGRFRYLAAPSRNGRTIFAPNSGHNIHIEDPALVIDAVREVVDRSRRERRNQLIILYLLIILAKIVCLSGFPMTDPSAPDKNRRADLDHSFVLSELIDLFRRTGWSVDITGPEVGVDFLAHRGSTAYAVELKVSAEGRADRLVPLWAQAYLEAQRATSPGWHPLAIVSAPSISDRATRQIIDFAHHNAPHAAMGIIDRRGRRHFEGEGLLGLTAKPRGKPDVMHASRRRVNLFSDINQWLMKVLLAPWIPHQLTSAPQGEYRNATELAAAAKVSVMSAYRLVESLREDNHLDEQAGVLHVVRRRELLERWRSWSSAQTPHEIPAIFLIPGNPDVELRAVLRQQKVGAALAFFAAADALHLGFVRGLPPHIYLPALTSVAIRNLENVEIAHENERPTLLIRQAPALQSVFRAAVRMRDGLATDVLQTWLDVSSHPTRGREQADEIERRVLGALLADE